MLVHREEKCFFLHKHFLFCSNDKNIPTLKQWQPTRIVAALSFESVRIVSSSKVHKRPKTAVAFKTLFCLQSLMGTPLFTANVFKRTPMW